MARMPAARWVGPHHDNGTMSRYDIVCLHTIVGYAPAHAAHFSTAGDGTIYQSRDTRYRSAANLNGNHRVISIENADHGPEFPRWGGSNVPAFSEAQIEAIAKICAWAHKTHGIPLVACPDSRPGSRGIAYHRQGIDGNFGPFKYGGRKPGGEVWSSSFGKVCPGDRRISQIPEIIKRARVIAGLDKPENPTPKGNDKVYLIARDAETGKVFIGDGIVRRWVHTEGGLNHVQSLLGLPVTDSQDVPVMHNIGVLGIEVTEG